MAKMDQPTVMADEFGKTHEGSYQEQSVGTIGSRGEQLGGQGSN